MARNMSFAITTEQFKAGTKTVTRRFGWWFLKPGDVVRAVVKGMGLKPGEKIQPLGMIRILSVRSEPLNAITQIDVIREGFPSWTPEQFVSMLVEHYRVLPTTVVNRIEFEHI